MNTATSTQYNAQHDYNTSSIGLASSKSISEALYCIPPDLPRDVWVRIAASLYSELGETGYEMFLNWSSGGSSFKPVDALSTWRSVKRLDQIKIATLFFYARQYGYSRVVAPATAAELRNRSKSNERAEKKERQHHARKYDFAHRIARDILANSTPLSECEGTSAHLYLQKRLSNHPLPLLGDDIRYHPWLIYHDNRGMKSEYPALIGVVRDTEGEVCSLHRTYLTENGDKAAVESPKKLTPSIGRDVTGGGIYTAQSFASRIVVTEGIENALALSIGLSIPAVAAISAHGLARFQPRTGIQHVVIGADNDHNHAGQCAAHKLQARLQQQGISSKVMLPDRAGTDWVDELAGGEV